MASQQSSRRGLLQAAEDEIRKAKEEIGDLLEKTQTGGVDKQGLETGLKEILRRLHTISFFDHSPE